MFLAVLILAFVIRRSKESDIFWLLSWPGTVVHELLHYVIGFVLFARPTKISVWPEDRETSGQTMGYVNFANIQWYNAMPTGLAPLLGVFVVLFIAGLVPVGFSLSGIFWIWVMASVLSQVWPSQQDWKVAFSSIGGLALYGGIVTVFLL
jgi:hypothetical protein